MLVANGMDEAVVGYIQRMNEPMVVVYCRDKCIDVIKRDGKMNEEEAEEFFEYNVAGAYVGNQTPAYLHRANIEQIHELADS